MSNSPLREYFPLAAAVAVLLVCWMLAVWLAPSPAVMWVGVFASGFLALGAGALAAWALRGGAMSRLRLWQRFARWLVPDAALTFGVNWCALPPMHWNCRCVVDVAALDARPINNERA